jgi:hypothetical protein
MGWAILTLAEVCTINPRRPELLCGDDTDVTFLPTSAVAEEGRKPQSAA